MKILLATDGSECSERAARFLTRLQWSRDDSLTVFHSIYAIPFREDEKFYFSQLREIKKEIAPRLIDATLAVLQPVQASISVEIEESPPNRCTPERCIIDAAESAGMDLIVLGARGIKGIASVLLGSVTRLVTLQSSIPVLVVKPAGTPASDRMKILFATDGSDHSRAAGELLSTLPFPGDSEVTVLNVASSGFADIPERYVLEVNDRIREAVAGARAQEFAESEKIIEHARTALSVRFRNIQALSKVGDPSTEILHAAEKAGADIIAVGCRGMKGIRGMAGSVSRNVLTHAKCSVLIGRTCKE